MLKKKIIEKMSENQRDIIMPSIQEKNLKLILSQKQ
jgi:hypothetical protein